MVKRKNKIIRQCCYLENSTIYSSALWIDEGTDIFSIGVCGIEYFTWMLCFCNILILTLPCHKTTCNYTAISWHKALISRLPIQSALPCLTFINVKGSKCHSKMTDSEYICLVWTMNCWLIKYKNTQLTRRGVFFIWACLEMWLLFSYLWNMWFMSIQLGMLIIPLIFLVLLRELSYSMYNCSILHLIV